MNLQEKKNPKLKYNKVVACKANIQKSIGFLYANNEQLGFEIKVYNGTKIGNHPSPETFLFFNR